MINPIQAFETSNGKIFRTREEAHQEESLLTLLIVLKNSGDWWCEDKVELVQFLKDNREAVLEFLKQNKEEK